MRVNEVIITRIDGAQRQHRQQRDQLDDALVQPAGGGALTEIDADILRGERRRRNNEGRY
jgi:hypothetical protein